MKPNIFFLMIFFLTLSPILFGQKKETVFSKEIISSYEKSFQSQKVKEATYKYITNQIKKDKPVAYIQGKLVYAINLSTLMKDKTISKEFKRNLKGSKANFDNYPGEMDRIGFAFVTASGIADIGGVAGLKNLPSDIMETFEDALDDVMTDITGVEILIGFGISFIAGMLVEECTDDDDDDDETGPNGDYDGDGKKNKHDADDDNDGVNDDDDDYPYDDDASICHQCKPTGIDAKFYEKVPSSAQGQFEQSLIEMNTSLKSTKAITITMNNKAKNIIIF